MLNQHAVALNPQYRSPTGASLAHFPGIAVHCMESGANYLEPNSDTIGR